MSAAIPTRPAPRSAIIHPEALAALAAHKPLGEFQALTIFRNGTAHAIYTHGLVAFDAEGRQIRREVDAE